MSKAVAILVGVLTATVVAGTAYVGVLRRQVRQTNDRLDRLESKQRDSAARAEVARLEEQVGKVEAEVAEAKRAVPAPVAPARRDASTEAPLGPLSADEISQLIDQKVEQKVKEKKGGFGGDNKRPLADVAKEVGLETGVQIRMAEVTNEAKDVVFQLLLKPRADGTNLVDEIIAAFTSGDQEKAGQVWMKMFKENVPGTNETYFAAALRVSDDVMKKFEKLMTPEEFAKYKHTGVGPLDLETGYDPFGEYWKSKQP